MFKQSLTDFTSTYYIKKSIKKYRCELCKTILLKRNKTKHNQTKKHKYFSNHIKNRYVI